jgi:hypothetical protein
MVAMPAESSCAPAAVLLWFHLAVSVAVMLLAIELLNKGMAELKDGVRMKGIFKILLELGNYINAGKSTTPTSFLLHSLPTRGWFNL